MKQTPKEKAKELFNHYYILIQDIGGELGQELRFICSTGSVERKMEL
jgi:hypothetical protein